MRLNMKKWMISSAVMMIALFIMTVGVSAASLSSTSATLKKGHSVTLTVNNANGPVVWKSTKKGVATVSATGLVVAKKKGTCKITAKTGGQTLTCTITVKQPVTSVKLNKTAATVKKGKTVKLKATCKPSNANVKKVTWKSSNPAVATVSSKGVVKAIAGGTAIITATTTDGTGLSKSCKITVPGASTPAPTPAPVSSGTIALPAPASLDLANGNMQTVTLTTDNVLQYFEPISYYDASDNTTSIVLRNRLESQGWYNTAVGVDSGAYAFIYADFVCTKSGSSTVSGTFHTRYTITEFYDANGVELDTKLKGKWNVQCTRIVKVTGKDGKGVAQETFAHKNSFKSFEIDQYAGFRTLWITLGDGRDIVINQY